MVGPEPWRLIESPPACGATNMAVDEALMASVRDSGAPVLRLYRWSPVCLSLGRNQPATARHQLAELTALGVEVVRRPTGGRAVLHADELTYAAVLPDRALGRARRAYRAINQALERGLRSLGVPAVLQPDGDRRAPRPSLEPCFGEPVAGELTVAGVKLVGSAQLRRDGVLLQHGSLPLRTSALPLGALAAVGETSGTSPALDRFLQPLPRWEEITGALVSAWAASFGPLEVSSLSAAELARAEQLLVRYRDDAWTWRS